ncbi:hypothetical protein NFI96_027343, partial [Prochilodus magdalenae]
MSSSATPVVPGPLDEASPDGTPPAPLELKDGLVFAVRQLLGTRR